MLPGPDPEIEKLTRENQLLQAKVAKFHLLEQKLLESKHLLELESQRFERMKAFMRAAMRPLAVRDTAALISEFIVDVLECEIGAFWCFRCGRDANAVYTSGCPPFDEETWSQLRVFFESCKVRAVCPAVPDLQDLPPGLDIGDFLVRRAVGDEGECFGILFAANTKRNARHYKSLNPAAIRPFDAFAEQVGAIIDSRRSRAVILDQAEKLRLSEQRLSMALTNSNVGLWDWNLAEHTIYFSEQWKMQLGYEDHEISDSFDEWKRRLHPDDAEAAVETAMRCARKPGSGFQQTFRMMHRNGEPRWIISNGTCLPDETGRPARMIGTHIDITALKAIEAKLREAETNQRVAKEEAVRANIAKSEFLAKISHDLRTPLNGILAAFQMLEGSGLPDGSRKLVEMGHAAGSLMQGIIGDSLDLSQIETGRLKLRVEVFNLPDLADSLKEAAGTLAARRKVEICWKQGSRLPAYCSGDRSRVIQVVSNLIDNAVKFTPEGGRVTVKIDPVPGHGNDKVGIRFRVVDSGPGLSASDVPRIFQPFHQLRRFPSTQVEGLGLGLAIVRELVDLMGGTIHVASRVGKGSSFTVVLPFGGSASSASRQDVGTKPWQRHFAGKVLFAEDDEISRVLGVMVLQRLGLEVTPAIDGVDALEKLGRQRFDLAILDCWMPRLGGIELAKRVRSGETGHPTMPMLALTADADLVNVEACFDAGINECIFKPLVVERLEEKLAMFLPSTPQG